MSKWKSCFICVGELKTGRRAVSRNLSNFKIVFNYLLNTPGNEDPLWKSVVEEEDDDYKPKVCDKCSLQMEVVTKLHMELEVIQMKLINNLEKIRLQIVNSSKLDRSNEPSDIFEDQLDDEEERKLTHKLHKFQSAVYERDKQILKVPMVFLEPYADNIEVLPVKLDLEDSILDLIFEPDTLQNEKPRSGDVDPVPESKSSSKDPLGGISTTSAANPKKPRPYHRRPPCPVCKKKFKSPDKMIRHHKLKHFPKIKVPNKCTHCPAEFRYIDRLMSHLVKEHGAPKFVCEHCGMEFSTKCTWRQHKKVEHDKTGFTCHHCGHMLPTRQRLDLHLISHSEERTHICALCGAQFKRAHKLKEHMEVHQNKRKYACPHCGKRFNLQKYLKDHIRIHEDARPFVCEGCGKGFKATGTLCRHKKSCQSVVTGSVGVENEILTDLN